MKTRVVIRIENPSPGGAVFTSLARAREFDEDGRAIFDEKTLTLRFLDDDHRHISVQRDGHLKCGYDRDVETGFMLDKQQLAGVPVMQAYRALIKPTKMRFYDKNHRNGKVRSIAA